MIDRDFVVANIAPPTVAEDVAFSLRRLRLPRAEVAERVAAMFDRYDVVELAAEMRQRTIVDVVTAMATGGWRVEGRRVHIG